MAYRGDNSKAHHNDKAHAKIKSGQVVVQDYQHEWRLVPALANDRRTSNVRGIAINDASEGEAVEVAYRGVVFFDRTFNAGWVYCLSSENAGEIVPFNDLKERDYAVVLGVANSEHSLNLNIQSTDVRLKKAPSLYKTQQATTAPKQEPSKKATKKVSKQA